MNDFKTEFFQALLILKDYDLNDDQFRQYVLGVFRDFIEKVEA